MDTRPEVIRAVFDTNSVVSALLFSKGRLAWLRAAWRDRSIIPLVSRATMEELLTVFQYPKFQLDKAEREELLGDFLPHAEVIQEDDPGKDLPICRDADDQKFLELAYVARADALVSRDQDLLACKSGCPFPILTPAELKSCLEIDD